MNVTSFFKGFASYCERGKGDSYKKTENYKQLERASTYKLLDREEIASIYSDVFVKRISEANRIWDKGKVLQIRAKVADNSSDKLLMMKNTDDTLIIGRVGNELGRGTYGKVKEVSLLLNNDVHDCVLKLAAHKFDGKGSAEVIKLQKRAVQQVYEEFQLLGDLHEKIRKTGRSSRGLQPAPFRLVVMYTPDGQKRVGHLGEKFDESISEIAGLFATPEYMPNQSLLCSLCTDCTAGLEALHDLGLHHGDIKLDNILYRECDQNGGYEACLADFGGAGPLQKKAERFILGVHSPKIVCPQDKEKMKNLNRLARERIDAGEEIDDLVSQSALLLKQMDVYLLSLTLFKLMTGHTPIEPESGIKGEEFPPSVPDEIIDILDRGLLLDGNKRPSAKELYEAFYQWEAQFTFTSEVKGTS
jgi:serine/threonine protein kinase